MKNYIFCSGQISPLMIHIPILDFRASISLKRSQIQCLFMLIISSLCGYESLHEKRPVISKIHLRAIH